MSMGDSEISIICKLFKLVCWKGFQALFCNRKIVRNFLTLSRRPVRVLALEVHFFLFEEIKFFKCVDHELCRLTIAFEILQKLKSFFCKSRCISAVKEFLLRRFIRHAFC